MKKLIEKEIKEQISTYKSKNRIISDYNKEQETFKEYNGRQVLELLQNADDEKSDEVLIKLNSNDSILEIANRGENCSPFSIGGIKSLMIANLSPKNRKKYIGNKGLGFRSIINWSNQIIIYTNNLKIDFSYDISKKIYKEKTGNEIDKIAFLSLPKVENYNNNDWITKIVINYKKEKLKDIEEQLKNIKDEVLLFVNNIKKLIIDIDGEKKEIERKIEDKKIYLNNISWNIFEYKKENLLPKDNENSEEEYFDLKIAIKENFNPEEKYFLYSFFPTEIDIGFPFIIHGTFDLDSSRNYINDSKKNRYILDKLVEFIAEIAIELTKNRVNYTPLEFLNYKNSNTRLENLGFYEKIDEKIDKLPIFPCLDKSYKRKDEVIFISDEFSEFVEKHNFNNIFPNMLISSKNSIIDLDNYDIFRKIDNLSLIDKMSEEMSKKIENIDERVELIYLVEKYFSNEDYIFELLIDENNKLISKDKEVYTPITKKYDFDIPDFVRIKFMNNELYEKLVSKFNINSKEKSRDLQRKLKSILNINSYEPAQVLQKIVTSSNKIIKEKETQEEKLDIIKKMVISLYEDFKNLDEKTKIPENIKIQLLNKNREIKNSEELFLSKSYPSGKLTEFLFKDIFDESQFLIDYHFFNFKDDEKEKIESFFVDFLRVNRYSKFSEIEIKKYYNNNCSYGKFIFLRINKPWNCCKTISFKTKKIEDLDKITNIGIEKFLLWILIDDKIKTEMSKKNEIKYIKTQGSVECLLTNNAPSYILYQLYNTKIFKDYLITSKKLSKLVNKIDIDFEKKCFKKYGIKKADIESLILKLGGVESFEEMSIERIREILREFAENKETNYTQTIYKAIRNHKEKLNDKTIKLCAKKNSELDYYNQDEIYYANNVKLPKKILSNVPIINIPPRLGNVVEFFDIKNINEIKIEIIEYQENSFLTEKFQEFFFQIQPFILVNRFENLNIDEKRKSVTQIKNSKIILCDKVKYKINNDEYELDDNDYIKNNRNYYIKVSRDKNFDEIRRKLDFRETFSDIIGSIFNISNVKNYERLISDDINETEEIIKREFGYEALQDAREFLNVADEFTTFWRIIYKLKGKTFNEKYKRKDISKIIEDLSIKIDLDKFDYQNINKNCETIQKLFSEFNLEINDFNNESDFVKIDLRDYHKQNLINYFNDNFDDFKKILYKWCLDKNKKEEFIDLKGKYETAEKIVENRLYINYQKIVEEFVNDNFNFSLKDEKTKINFDEIYKNNSINFESEELENREKSLLYFENGNEEVKKIVEEKKEKERIVNKKITFIDDTIPEIEENFEIKSRTPSISDKYSNRSYGNHKISIDKKKRKKGVKAEECVYNYLIKNESNVEWVSRENDNAHYDIRYKKEDKWNYVEVKTFSNNVFYMSKAEKEFADANRENYEIFLVELGENCGKSKIKKVINYDELEELNFVPSEYKIYYSLKNNKKGKICKKKLETFQ
jgi:hypothetical protein